MTEEFFPVFLTLEILLEHVVCDHQSANDQEQERIREFLIDHVEPVVGTDTSDKEIMAVGEDLRGRLETSGHRAEVLQPDHRQVIRDVAHVEAGDDRVIWLELVTLELNFHGLFLLLEVFGVGEREPAGSRLDVLGARAASRVEGLGKVVDSVLRSDEDERSTSDVVGCLSQGD